MATVIGVGMQMTASAAGMTKGLSEADRALQLLQKIVEQNQQSLAKFGQQATKTSEQLDSLSKTTTLLSRIEIGRLLIDGAQAIGGAVSSVVGQISGLVSSVNASVDTLNDLSARTGIGVEQLQKYAFAAKLAGVDTAEFGSAVQKLAVNIGKATPGGELDKSLRGINLTVTQLRALAPEKQFDLIGRSISQLPTAADRAAASVAIFGKQGAALAPLFREGAAGIEELQSRAEKLGVIISETQVNNVADMNDAFDTVRATIEGIIGQVIGNLAPAVTKVLEDLLKFVETYQNAAGETGGNAFANAVTDAFIQGARLFVGILERFGVVAKQVAAALGVDLRTDAEKQLQKLEAQAAAGMAPQITVPGAGGFATEIDPNFLEELRRLREQVATETEDSVFNATTKWIDDFEANVKKARLPEVKLATNIEDTRQRFLQFFADSKQQSVELANSFRLFAGRLAFAKADGEITAQEMEKIQESVTEINSIMDQELATRRELEAATKAQAQADDQRIANLLKAGDAQNKIAQDLSAVEREQARVQQELNAARDAGQRQQADQAAARLAQLDQLQASLQDQQQAFEQGFGDGFGKVFEATNKQIGDLVNKAAEFGNAGAEAAQQFQEGVARVQQQARDGILNAEAYQAEIERQRALFEQQIGAIRQEEQEKLAAAKRVEDFLRTGIDARHQAELDATKQLEERKKQAAQNVAAIQAKIDEQQKQLQEARDKGNIRDARNGAARLQQLRALQREEDQIAQGRNRRLQQTFSGAARQQNETFTQFANAATKQIQQFNNAVSQSVSEVNNALDASAESFRKAAREERASLMLGPQQIAVSDVRTAEGQQMVLDAAAQYQDPALIQMRQSNALLKQINQGLLQNLARIGMPAVIS